MPFSSDSPIVTVLGGGGFIGRYACEALLKAGARLRVAQRDPKRAFFLQPLGQVGQVSVVAADFARPGPSMHSRGAQERTRTSTPLRAPAPEAGASTNSATWAQVHRLHG